MKQPKWVLDTVRADVLASKGIRLLTLEFDPWDARRLPSFCVWFMPEKWRAK